jgi:hypothetical protein
MTTTTVRDGWCSTSVGSRSAPLSASGRILRSWLGNIAGVGGRTSNGCGYCPREADSCGDAGWRGTRRRVARQRVRLMGGWPQVVRRPPRAPLRGSTCSPGRAPSLEPWHPECAGESPPPTMSSRSMQGPVERTSVARRHACAGSVHRMGATRRSSCSPQNPWIGQVQRRGRFPRRLTNPCDEPLCGGAIEAPPGRLVYSATNAMTREQYALPIVQSEPGTVRAR